MTEPYIVSVDDHCPRPDSQWPNPAKILEEFLVHLSPDDRMRVLRTNADELIRLELPAR